MYIRTPHREENLDVVLDFIQKNDFATLVSFDGEKPVATHLLLAAERGEAGEVYLEGHLARANPQWKTFDASREILAVFLGANAYLSPTWYAEPLENVPTWNYISAHVYGVPRIVEDEEELTGLMRRLVEKYEKDSGYKLENLPEDFVGRQLRGIVGFRVRVTRIEASYKLAQTLDARSYENVVVELEKSGGDDSREIARAMREKRAL
jgi:transcriptional regulator